MKYIILVLGLVTLGVIIFITTQKELETTAKVVMVDITDEFIVQPTSDYFKRSFNFQDYLWHGALFRQRTISDITFAIVYEHTLPSAKQWLSNEAQRTHEVNQFFNEIQSTIDTISSIQNERIQSAIYLSIVDELNYLVHFPANEKALYIFSDLREHSAVLNTYQSSTLKLLSEQPNQIKQRFEEVKVIPDLTSIDIYIIYQPKSFEDAKAFESIAMIYKSMLEEKKAVVHISGNLQNN